MVQMSPEHVVVVMLTQIRMSFAPPSASVPAAERLMMSLPKTVLAAGPDEDVTVMNAFPTWGKKTSMVAVGAVGSGKAAVTVLPGDPPGGTGREHQEG